ncbi:hypothetical protein N1851_015471 [Merluccius polli]|uniref:Reverse transcriptase n=1 Tax=Merluccius polli TaxID=89951 RepID=A0AA47MT39_MERPO|nr:hypothetical protein N1851_015471 [Merluccius polli]
MAFQSGNEQQYRLARYALLKSIRTAKKSHTEKFKNCYTGNDSRRMWQGIQAVTNYKGNKHTASTSDTTLPDKLNSFYARFDTHQQTTMPALPSGDLGESLQVNPRKAGGPDGVSQRVLKACAAELAEVYTNIFNSSLAQAVVPLLLKYQSPRSHTQTA